MKNGVSFPQQFAFQVSPQSQRPIPLFTINVEQSSEPHNVEISPQRRRVVGLVSQVKSVKSQ
jgi:hypothetical protein